MSSIANIYVISPDTHSERRIDPHITVLQLKGKLELITGIPVANQILNLLASETDTRVVASLNDDTKLLGYYGLTDWQVIKVDDANPTTSLTGQLTDVTQVEKFDISDADYANRQDSVLAYKQRHKVGRFALKSDHPHEEEDQSSEKFDHSLGSRCEVESTAEGLHKRGFVRYVGLTKFSKGIWVGIEYDEPFGKNDGSVQGERYFSCRPNYGVFVRPEKVKVGDYPIEEIQFEEM